jgi:hypothetical protein
MINYEDLSDQEKYIDYPEEFVEELRTEYHNGNEDVALTRAEEVGLDIRDIIS